MSLTKTLSVIQNNDAKFDSIPRLNADLDKTSIGELLEECLPGEFIKQDASGAISFRDREDDGAYHDEIEVWSCFEIVEAETIADHLISGSLILRLEIEGNEPKYFKIEPGSAKKVAPTMTF